MNKKVKKQTKAREKREYKSNVIQFSSVQKTRTGIAVWIGSNVIFINEGLLNYIKKAS